jgi:hypothetical protein
VSNQRQPPLAFAVLITVIQVGAMLYGFGVATNELIKGNTGFGLTFLFVFAVASTYVGLAAKARLSRYRD